MIDLGSGIDSQFGDALRDEGPSINFSLVTRNTQTSLTEMSRVNSLNSTVIRTFVFIIFIVYVFI